MKQLGLTDARLIKRSKKTRQGTVPGRLLKTTRLKGALWRPAADEARWLLPSGRKVANLARFACFQAHQSLGARPSTCRHPRIAQANQVAGGQGQHEREVQLLSSRKAALAHPADDPGPAEAFLDPLAEPLTHGVARMAGGASINDR